eukprot:2135546-Alexandrium_andersonii.AAC.1
MCSGPSQARPLPLLVQDEQLEAVCLRPDGECVLANNVLATPDCRAVGRGPTLQLSHFLQDSRKCRATSVHTCLRQLHCLEVCQTV